MSKGMLKVEQPDEVLEALRGLVGYNRKIGDLAKEFGVSQAFMSAVLAGKKQANDQMLVRIGWKREVKYTKLPEASNDQHH